ncbi:MAG: endolytic transglycosylase MltG [Candidatus Alcyoniella australis]|nr:endolytic transglycosylase MltG [Candidatus Alcyoniella australis]
MARKKLNRTLIVLIVVVTLVVVCVAALIAGFLLRAPGQGQEVRLLIEQGSSLAKICEQLEQAGLISDQRAFALFVRRMNKDRSIRAGEYSLRDDLRPGELLEALTSGSTVAHVLTVPEGYNIKQIAALFDQQGIAAADEVIALAHDSRLIAQLGVEAPSLEGYLFPETYHYELFQGPRELLTAMVQQLDQVYTPRLQRRAKQLGMTKLQVLTLASLIEKETAQAQERPLISAVFHSRIERGIPLACDPTVIYGIADFDGNLRRSHLRDRSNRYNTYLHKDLPPGPIANPGAGAIEAALYPADVPYLYFVSRNDGSHQFSTTLAEHNRAVRRFQRAGSGGRR